MQNYIQQNIREIAANLSIEREEMLLKKYTHYIKLIKDSSIRDMITEFMDTSKNHIKAISDKMKLISP